MTTQAPPSYREVTPTTPRHRSPRYVNAALGAWLFVSAFLWQHADAAFTNTWLVGLLMTICALAALRAPAVRLVNAALGLWLMASTFIFPAGMATFWNNLMVGGLVLIISLLDGARSGAVSIGGRGGSI